MPMKIVELELTEDLGPIWGMEGYEGLCALARYHGEPVGWIYTRGLNQAVVSPACLYEAIRQQISWQLLSSMLRADPEALCPQSVLSPPISIVVCTSDRTVQLESCLQALASLAYPYYEVIMVDAASASHGHAQLVTQYAIRYAAIPAEPPSPVITG